METNSNGRHTFGHWLKQQTKRQDAVGDVARDFVTPNEENVRCCSRFQRYDTILRHIRFSHNPCPAAEEALRKAYDEYANIVRSGL